jgi:hypothetical protein
LAFDEDDVPLAILKKQKFGYKAPANSLCDMEVVALSLTELQHDAPIKGPVYNFLNSPLIGTLAHPNAMVPRFPFAATGCSDFQVTQATPPTFSTAGPTHAQPIPSAMDV